MPTVKVPDGKGGTKEYTIPSDPDKRALLAGFIDRTYGIDINETTTLGQAKETLKGIPRGIARFTADVPLGVASLFDMGNDSDFVQGLKQYKDFLSTESSLAADPLYADKWMTKLGEGIGSFVPFLGAGAAGRALLGRGVGAKLPWYAKPTFAAPASLAIPSGIAQQTDLMDAAKAQGEDVGPVAEVLSELAGGVIGLSEVFPVMELFKRVPKNALRYSDIRRKLNSALRTGTHEALQEAGASIAQSAVARGLYSDKLPIFDSIFDELTIGGTVGALADLTVNAMSGRSKGRAFLADRESRARKNRIDIIQSGKFERATTAGTIEEDQGLPPITKPEIPVPPVTEEGPLLEVIQNPDETFSVVNLLATENPVIKTFDGEADALSFKNQEQTNYERKKLKVEIDNATYALGMPDSSTAKIIGSTVLDPNSSEINLQSIVNFDSKLSKDRKKKFNKERIEIFGPNPYRQMLANKQAHLKEIGKYIKSKGLDLKSSYSMAEVKKMLTKKDYNALLGDLSNLVFAESEKAGEPSIRADKEKVNVNIKYIKEIAASKNIEIDFKDPAVRYAALRWTGTENISKSSRAVKELFLARLHSLPKFNNVSKFPDFRPRIYTAQDVANFVASAGSQNVEFTVNDLLNQGVTSKNKAATEQFISDLVDSGRAEKIKETNRYRIIPNHEFNIARRAEGFNETPTEFGERLRQEGKIPEEVILQLVEKERINQRKVLPPEEVEPKLFNFGEAVEQGRINKFALELKKILSKRGLKETGVIVSNDILSTSNLVEDASGKLIFDPSATRGTPVKGAIDGEYDRATDTIFISLNAINPNGTASEAEIQERLSSVLDHEMIHALRAKDLITEKEYQYLRKEVKRRKVPKDYDSNYQGRTFYQRAVSINQGTLDSFESVTKERAEEFFIEEAIAEMYRARNYKSVAPKAEGIFNKVVEFFRSMGQAMRTSGFQRSSEVFTAIESGEAGRRTRDKIRTLRELDRMSPAAQEAEIIQEYEEPPDDGTQPADVESFGDMGAFITPTTSWADVESDTDPITGVLVTPTGRESGVLYERGELTPEQFIADKNLILSRFGHEHQNSLEVLEWLSQNAPGKDYKTIADRLLTQMKKLQKAKKIDFQLRIINDGKQRLSRVGHKGYKLSWMGISFGTFENTKGESDPKYKYRQQIYINDTRNYQARSNNGVDFETILHELVHQATQAATYHGVDPKTREIVKNLETLRKRIKQEIRTRGPNDPSVSFYVKYGTKNVQELLAVGFTDRNFQKFMESIPYAKQGKKSLWDKFTESLRKLLNIPAKMETVFSEFLLSAGKITALTQEQIKPLFRGDFQEGPAAVMPAFSREPPTRKSIEDEISSLEVQLIPLESEMRQEGHLMSQRNYKILDNKMDNLYGQINQLKNQLGQTPEQTRLFSRDDRQSIYRELDLANTRNMTLPEAMTYIADSLERNENVLGTRMASYPIIARKVREQIKKLSRNANIKFKYNIISGRLDSFDRVMATTWGGAYIAAIDEQSKAIFDDPETKETAPHAMKQMLKRNASGISMQDKDLRFSHIYINDLGVGEGGLNHETILHEAIHAATMPFLTLGLKQSENTSTMRQFFEKSPKARELIPKSMEAIKSFENIQRKINEEVDRYRSESLQALIGTYVSQNGREPNEKELIKFGINNNIDPVLLFGSLDGRNHPGLTSVEELVTYGLTNKGFQQFLESVPYRPNSKKTLWDSFVETIRKLLGLSAAQDTALSAVLSAGEDILSIPTEEIEALGEIRENIEDVKYTKEIRDILNNLNFEEGKRFSGESNTSENIQLREAVEKAEEITKQVSRGDIPYYNINASDVALKAAIDFNEDATPKSPPKDIPNWSAGTIPPELADSIRDTGYGPPKKSFGARLMDVANDPVESVRKFFKDTRQNYIDKLDKVSKTIVHGSEVNEDVRLANNAASTSTIAALRLADKVRGIFQGLLMGGYASDTIEGASALTNVKALTIDTVHNPFIEGNTGTGGLMQIMAPLYADPTVDLEAVFALYGKLKRVKNMNDQGIEIATPVKPKDLEQIRLIERKYKSVVETYNNYQRWNNKLIEFAEAKGLLDAEQAALWRSHSSYYPFYREMVDDEGMTAPAIGGGSLPNNPLNIKMKGSEREITVNPIEAIARNSLSILTASMKNDGTLKLLRDLESMGEARPVTPIQKKKGNLNTIFAFEDGNKQYWEIDDVELFHGIQAVGGVKTDAITKILAFPASILRDTVTRDPGFVVVNLLRDTLSAAITSGAPLSIGKEGFTPIVDTVKNMFADMSDLERFGVIGGYDFQNDEGSIVTLMNRARRQKGLTPDNGIKLEDAFYKVWDGLGYMTTKSDGATRLAVYDAVYNYMKDNGYNEADAQSEAAYQALEIINFGRRGLSPMFRVVTSAIPFLNARIQGLDVLYRSATGQYSAVDKMQEGETIKDVQNRITRKFALRASAMIAATAIYYLLVSDTDEYKEVKREVRDDNWIIPNPFARGYPIKIPIPFEVGMLFKAIPERLLDMAMGEDAIEKDPLKSISRQFGTSLNIPIVGGDIGIQAVKPIFEAFTNRNSFTNTDIVPYYQLKELPAYQARKSTNELARLLGEMINVSPMKIEHVLTGYTGTLGGYVLDVIDVVARSMTGTPLIPPNINDIPLIKRLFIDMDKAGGLQQGFYELREEVERATQTINDLKDQGRMDELYAYRNSVKGVMQVKSQVNAINRYMANWRRRRDRLLKRTDISISQKSDMMREMELDRDTRLAVVPALRQRADVPHISLGN